jgi:hypothetical protein
MKTNFYESFGNFMRAMDSNFEPPATKGIPSMTKSAVSKSKNIDGSNLFLPKSNKKANPIKSSFTVPKDPIVPKAPNLGVKVRML